MRTLKASILALGLTAGFASTASAQLNFDDITAAPFAHVSNYGGLNFTNAHVNNPIGWFGSPAVAGGFYTARSSGTHVMANTGGWALTMSGPSAFNLAGGNFAAAWMTGLNLNAAGYLNGNLVYNQNYSLNWNTAQYLGLNMYNVDAVVFTSSGGTPGAGFPQGVNHSFVMDDLTFATSIRELPGEELGASTVVPEPMSMSLVGFGLLALGGVQARRRRKVATV